MGPEIAAIVGIGSAVVGAGTSIYSGVQASAAAGRQADYYEQMQEVYRAQERAIEERARNEQKWREYNAANLELHGEFAAAIGAMNEAAFDLDAMNLSLRGQKVATEIAAEVEALGGRQAAGYAAGGVEISSGSPLVVMSETVRAAEEDIADVLAQRDLAVARAGLQGDIARVQGEMGELGYQFQAGQERLQGDLALQEAEWAKYDLQIDQYNAMLEGRNAETRGRTALISSFGQGLGQAGSAASRFFTPIKPTTTYPTMPPDNWQYFG